MIQPARIFRLAPQEDYQQECHPGNGGKKIPPCVETAGMIAKHSECLGCQIVHDTRDSSDNPHHVADLAAAQHIRRKRITLLNRGVP